MSDSDSTNPETDRPGRSVFLRKAFLIPVLFVVVLFLVLWSVVSGLLGVWYEWRLGRAAERLDRLVVEPVPQSDFADAPSFELEGEDKVKEFFENVELEIFQDRGRCMCRGSLLFRFFRDEEEVLVLSYHHGQSLRWEGGPWPGDAQLTEASQQALAEWFAQNGYDVVQEARDKRLAEERRQALEDATFIEAYPEHARSAFSRLSGFGPDFERFERKQAARLVNAIPDAVQLAVVSCRALGTVEDSWSGTGHKERIALRAACTVSGDDFLKALNILEGDRRGLLGAARLFFWERYIEKIPAERRAEWAIHLAEISLSTDEDDNKPLVLRTLARLGGQEVKAFLWRVARGEVGRNTDSYRSVDSEPGLRAAAYLAIAQQGDDTIIDEVKQLLPSVASKQDRAALEVSLALLGNAEYVKKEHFQIPSYTIGFAALQAIERFEGKEGMDVLVEAGLHHPWGAVRDEAVLAAQRITGQQWLPKARSVKPEAELVESWWKAHGDEFVKQRRARK